VSTLLWSAVFEHRFALLHTTRRQKEKNYGGKADWTLMAVRG
jgi:hypothetical protein